MANLRLVIIKAVDSRTITARFTESLSPLINTSSVVISSSLQGVPNAEVKRIIINGSVMTVITQPMTPNAFYIVTFKTTSSSDFKSVNGSFLLEDGVTNAPSIIGPEDPDNPIKKFLINLLKDNVYNLDSNTLVDTIINADAGILSKALYDIGQVKNENYIQFTVFDERKTRGAGPYDRLNEESAFDIIRVGKSQTNTVLPGSISFPVLPSGPITLQIRTISNEKLPAGTGPSTFDGLILTVNKATVTKLISVSVLYADSSVDTYDIAAYGYQVKNPRYDQEFASTFLALNDNQFKLSDLSLEDNVFRLPVPGDIITVNYEYKNEGIYVDEESVLVSQVLDATRETTPPILTDFTLNHVPVVTAGDTIATFNGVTFLDPESNPPFSATHPAFTREIPFRVDALPRNFGEYSVDYENSRVFVYGATSNDGTGNFPPTATYKYRNSFRADLDYTYDPDFVEFVASPLRDLVGDQIKISFNYESALIPDIDFKAKIHQEQLDERINNNLNSSNSLSVENAPITNVFRIFNETTGEVYGISRFNNEKIYFTSNNSPRIFSAERERASFTDVPNETLFVNNEFLNGSSVRIFRFLLQNANIMSSTEETIGSSFNSSATFSRNDLFVTELYFDGQGAALSTNTDRLVANQYQIDYENGIIYLGVSATQNFDIGTVNYKKSTIRPQHDHIIAVSEIYNSISTITGINKRIELSSFGDIEILPARFDRSDERFLNGDLTMSYIYDSGTITVQDDIKNVRGVYDAADLTSNIDITNFADGATTSANVITLNPNGVLKTELSIIASGPMVTVPFISSGAQIASVISVTRVSDNIELYDVGGSFLGYDIALSGIGSPIVGEMVLVTYRVELNGASTPIVDYNRGD